MTTNDKKDERLIRKRRPQRVFGVTGGRSSSFQRRYGMGDPLAPDPKGRENSGGGRLARHDSWRASPVRNALK
jgi:hypothetical protein